MAYLATVTSSTRIVAQRRHVVVTVVETGTTGNTHEFSFAAPDSGIGTLAFHHAVLATGGAGITATQVDPQVGESTGSSGSASVWANGAASADTRNAPDARGYASAGLFYSRSMCDGNIGTTGTITTTMVWVEGAV